MTNDIYRAEVKELRKTLTDCDVRMKSETGALLPYWENKAMLLSGLLEYLDALRGGRALPRQVKTAKGKKLSRLISI
jgi:hypothetical protein